MKIIQWISKPAEKKRRGFHGGLTGWCTDDRNYCTGASGGRSYCTGASSLPRGRYKGDESMSSVLSYREHVHEGSHGSATPGALHHNNPIPDGYARVTVEEIVQGAEEVEAGAAADLEKWKASCKKKIEGEPKPVFSDEQKKWAKTFLNTPSQAAKNLPDYERELRVQALTFRRKQEEAEKQEKKALEEAQKKLERETTSCPARGTK
ncbi:hypothetical protein QYE76_062915 [Lolium multiflorum]|uniref:Uncharacterized protein n=1 Tax=Lolium multiflorum TaxID=4521 RepID=A0AAD8W7P4_LOLMU|nr:hypothetical protein QYE76_062915 [Lolium multiflorum]